MDLLLRTKNSLVVVGKSELFYEVVVWNLQRVKNVRMVNEIVA